MSSSNHWAEFWQGESQSFFKIMRMSTAVFAKRFKNKFSFSGSQILDFGCGPGFLIEHLTAADSLTGLDINAGFIDVCKNTFPNHSFHTIPHQNPELRECLRRHLTVGRYDYIILLSISQYYPSQKAFEETLEILVPYLKKGGMIVIADVISSNTSSLKDLKAISFESFKSGNLLNLVKFISYLLFSNYKETSRLNPLLKLEDENFESIASSLKLEIQKFNGLTLHPTRNNYVLINR